MSEDTFISFGRLLREEIPLGRHIMQVTFTRVLGGVKARRVFLEKNINMNDGNECINQAQINVSALIFRHGELQKLEKSQVPLTRGKSFSRPP